MYEHFKCPKPPKREPFIAAIPPDQMHWYLGRLVPAERAALLAIVENADIVRIDDRLRLWIDVTDELIDALAAFGADGEDLEPIFEDEKDEGEEDDRDSDNPADRQAMNNRGMPYDDEEENGDCEREAP